MSTNNINGMTGLGFVNELVKSKAEEAGIAADQIKELNEQALLSEEVFGNNKNTPLNKDDNLIDALATKMGIKDNEEICNALSAAIDIVANCDGNDKSVSYDELTSKDYSQRLSESYQTMTSDAQEDQPEPFTNEEGMPAGDSAVTVADGKLQSVKNEKSGLDLSDMKYDGDDLTEVKIGETTYESKGEYVKGESKEPGIYTEKGNYVIVKEDKTQIVIKQPNDKGVTKIVSRDENGNKISSFAIDENNKPLFTVVYSVNSPEDEILNGKTVKYFANDKKIRVYGEDENGKFQSEDYKYENNVRGNKISTQTYGDGGIKKATFYKEDGTTPESDALYGTENGKRTKTVTDSSGNSTKYIWNAEESIWEIILDDDATQEAYNNCIDALNNNKEIELEENLDGKQLADLFNALKIRKNINDLLPADGLNFVGIDEDAIKKAIEKMVVACCYNHTLTTEELQQAVEALRDLDANILSANGEDWYIKHMNEVMQGYNIQ